MKRHHVKVEAEFEYARQRRKGYAGRHWDHSLKRAKRFINRAIRRRDRVESRKMLFDPNNQDSPGEENQPKIERDQVKCLICDDIDGHCKHWIPVILWAVIGDNILDKAYVNY